MGLQQTSPIGAGSKAGLEVMPVDSVALRDGHCPGERAPTRRSARECVVICYRVDCAITGNSGWPKTAACGRSQDSQTPSQAEAELMRLG